MKFKYALFMLCLFIQVNSLALWGYGKPKKIAPHLEEINGWSYWNDYDEDSKIRINHTEFHFVLINNSKNYGQMRLFDYARAKDKSRDQLYKYLSELTQINPKKLNQDEQLAYWLNMYNALMIKLATEHYPVLSMNEIKLKEVFYGKDIWDVNLIKINGTHLSLNNIEHQIIRAYWDPAQVFFGINHGNISDPPLSMGPFTGKHIKYQLANLTKHFVNDTNRVHVTDKVVTVSQVFQWHIKDFKDEQALIHYFQKYATGRQKVLLTSAIENNAKIAYKPYDWMINDYKLYKEELMLQQEH